MKLKICAGISVMCLLFAVGCGPSQVTGPGDEYTATEDPFIECGSEWPEGSECIEYHDFPIKTYERKYKADHFSGAFAQEIYRLYRIIENDSVAELIADGAISADDLSELHNQFSACMLPLGFRISFTEGGGYSEAPVTAGDWDESVFKQSSDATAICQKQTSVFDFDMLYNWIKANPENINRDYLIVQCMKPTGVLPEDYTADEYRYELDREIREGKMFGIFAKAVENSEEGDRMGDVLSHCQNFPLEPFPGFSTD